MRRIENLKLLSKLERAGVLSKLEGAGIDLDFIVENRLLSKAEDFGAVRLLSDRCGPSATAALLAQRPVTAPSSGARQMCTRLRANVASSVRSSAHARLAAACASCRCKEHAASFMPANRPAC